MKKTSHILIILVLFFSVIHQCQAWDKDEVRISPFIGYTIGGNFNDYYYGYRDYYCNDIALDDGPVWGVRVGVGIMNGVALEFSAAHMVSEFRAWSYDDYYYERNYMKMTDVDLYIMQGNLVLDLARGALEPYLSIGMGATVLDREIGDKDTEFTANVASGIVIKITDKLGFRAELRSYALYFGDAYSSCGDSYGSGWDYLNNYEATFGLTFSL